MKVSLLTLALLFLASCSVQTGDSGVESPAAPPTTPVCKSNHGLVAETSCAPNYCTALGASRETYGDVTFCHEQNAWLDYSTVALAQSEVETRAAQILVNPRVGDLPAPTEDGPTLCKRLGGADFLMARNPAVRGCLFVDNSAVDEGSLLKGKNALTGTKLLTLLTAKSLRPDSCMTPDLPACAPACAPSSGDPCGSPCSADEGACASDMSGSRMTCENGRWQCNDPGPGSVRPGCSLACRWD